MSIAFIICLIIFFLSFALRIPVAFGMIISSICYFLIKGDDLGIITEVMVFGFEDKFILLAIPLFILTARLMNSGGITNRIYRFADTLVGHMKGGVAHGNVVSSIIFSGMTGSALADASGPGLMAIKAMDDAKYERPFSCAVTAASATIGPIIPPSIPMIIYSMLSGASVGSLFLGGVIPGLVMGAGIMALIYFLAERRGYQKGEKYPLKAILKAFKEAFLSLMTPVILLGGIYSGVFTPTEASAVAVLYALFLLIIVYRQFRFKDLVSVINDVVENTGFLGFIIAGAFIFGHVIALEQLPAVIAEFLTNLNLNKWVLLLLVNVLFLILGCFLDTMVLLLIVIPIVLPAISQAGIDPVHFGVVVVLNLMIGLITPPFGMLLFTLSGLTYTPLSPIIRETIPFIIMLILVLLICTYIPEIVLFLPKILG
ncbi:MAG: TRAP transporter large permease [Nitrospirota bacterium]